MSSPSERFRKLVEEDGGRFGDVERMTPEGSILTSIRHDHPDWIWNNHEYRFGPMRQGILELTAYKHPGPRFDILVRFSPGHHFEAYNLTLQKKPDPTLNVVAIAVTWSQQEINFYLNGDRAAAAKLKSPAVSRVDIWLHASNDEQISMSDVRFVIAEIKSAMNFLSLANSIDSSQVLQGELDNNSTDPSVRLVDITDGSIKTVWEASKKTLKLFRQYVGEAFAVINGYSKRLSEAHVREREAQAQRRQAEADAEVSRAAQERIKTINAMTNSCREIDSFLKDRYPDLPDEKRAELVQIYFTTPLTRLANLAFDKGVIYEISDKG